MKGKYSILLFLIVFLLYANLDFMEKKHNFRDIYSDNFSEKRGIDFKEGNLKINFALEEFSEREKNKILKLFNKDNYEEGFNISKEKDKDEYSILNNNIKGKIYWVKDKEATRVNINLYIQQHSYIEVIEDLEKSLESKIKEEFKTFNYRSYKYIKMQLQEENLQEAKNNLINNFKVYGIKNEETLNISNGFTGNIILKNGQFLNYALCEYTFGTYLYIGTPIITCVY